MSNFDFLKNFDENLWKWGNRIEKNVNTAPQAVKADATNFLEHILKNLLNRIGKKYNSRKGFYYQLDEVYRNNIISFRYKDLIYSTYELRNQIHGDISEIEKNEKLVARDIHRNLYYIAKKYYRDYSESYDKYKGVPDFKEIAIDTSSDESELIEKPYFDDLVDISYDYCVICGEPNHSSYSICCDKCNQKIENANNIISVRNTFGKEGEFTKEDLIEFGIQEAYTNQLVNALTLENVLNVKGRKISFNNRRFDSYISEIEDLISIGELLTKFLEDKITPADIKKTREYKEGSLKHEPFYKFYQLVNDEVINKFERDILSTHNIKKSIEYTTISQNQLNRWWDINKNNYEKSVKSESFIIFNNSLIDEYLTLKEKGLPQNEIKKQLNMKDGMFEFLTGYDDDFVENINEIKKDLIIRALSENKSKAEAIEFAGITPAEYERIVTFSNYKNDEFAQLRAEQISERKRNFIKCLEDNDLKTSCEMTNITLDEFYEFYNKNNFKSESYIKSTKLLMDKYLNARQKGLTKKEACDKTYIHEDTVEYWLNRKVDIFDDFKNKNIAVIAELMLDGFKKGLKKSQIAEICDITPGQLNNYLNVGRRGSPMFLGVYEYYENNVFPKLLDEFLNDLQRKDVKKALSASDLTFDEIERYLSESPEFKKEFYDIRVEKYISEVMKGKNHQIALKNADLSDEYEENKEDIICRLTDKQRQRAIALSENIISITEISRRINVDLETFDDWFIKGWEGDEKYKEFTDAIFENSLEFIYNNSLLYIQSGVSEKIYLKEVLKKRSHSNYYLSKKVGLIVLPENNFSKDKQMKILKQVDEEMDEIFETAKTSMMDDETPYYKQTRTVDISNNEAIDEETYAQIAEIMGKDVGDEDFKKQVGQIKKSKNENEFKI